MCIVIARTVELLRSARKETIWGLAVHNSLDNDSSYLGVQLLLSQLRDQYRDSPRVMLECFSKPVKELLS
jgi:hypothetical protein